jgi:large subunit ribosomal protein L18
MSDVKPERQEKSEQERLNNMNKRQRKHRTIRKRVIGTSLSPRLAVFKSNNYIYAQIIDDSKGVTLASASDLKMDKKLKKSDKALMVGEELAKKAIKKEIKKVVFDRGGFWYHGRISKIAEGARKGGLEF